MCIMVESDTWLNTAMCIMVESDRWLSTALYIMVESDRWLALLNTATCIMVESDTWLNTAMCIMVESHRWLPSKTSLLIVNKLIRNVKRYNKCPKMTNFGPFNMNQRVVQLVLNDKPSSVILSTCTRSSDIVHSSIHQSTQQDS